MFPHERSLVEKLKDAPFALIGVNSDKNLDEMRPKMKEEKITWRSFYDESTGGPIASAWKVHGWPTLYLIDAQGKIALRSVGNPGDDVIEESIDWVVAKAKGGRKADAPPAKKAGAPD